MIKVYEPQETLFNHNGLKILHPIKAEIYIEDNGEYYISIESSLEDLETFIELGCDRIGTSRAIGLCKGQITKGY